MNERSCACGWVCFAEQKSIICRHARVHFYHAGGDACPSSGQEGSRKHHAGVLSGRQDRRDRHERLRQELADPDHGRRRHGVHGRGQAVPGHQDRLLRAGAGLGQRAHGDRGRERRRGRHSRADHRVRGREHEARRAALGRRDDAHLGQAGGPARQDRRGRRLEPRSASGAGHGRAAFAAGRRGDRQALRW